MSQSLTIEELRARVHFAECELIDARTFGDTQAARFACQTALDAAEARLAVAELQAELVAIKAHWEERWSRRWEP